MTNFVRHTNAGSTYGRPADLIKADYKEIDPLLIQLLSKCTPHGTEAHIIDVIKKQPYVKELMQQNNGAVLYDKTMFNFLVRVGESRTVFSCHMDIVGSNDPKNTAANKVDKIVFLTPDTTKKENYEKYGVIWGAKEYENDEGGIRYESSTLGADDKVGVYILLKMIEAKIPGMYLFHTGEEVGGKGSSHLATKHRNIFTNIDRAIAFDRANYGDVICYQRGRRCCSKTFGEALAAELNIGMPPKQQFKSDIEGTFTDTASYMDFIPECTNISVGYFNQHGAGEHLDTYWLETWLLPRILQINYETLPTERDPTKKEYKSYNSGYSHNYGTNNVSSIAKKPWNEIDEETKYWEFPLWTPRLNWPEGASKKTLATALNRYVGLSHYGTERDEFVEFIINGLEYKSILEEEVLSLKIALAKATGTELPAIPKIEALGHDAHVRAYLKVLMDSGVWYPGPHNQEQTEEIYEYPSEYIEKKKSLLTRLIVLAESVKLEYTQQHWLANYSRAAKKLLTKMLDKPTVTEKQKKKLNTYIFSMGSLIDHARVLSGMEEKLLQEIEAHICDTADEDGYFVEVRGAIEDNTKKPLGSTDRTVH